MKKIDICGKEFEIDCNAFTYIEYRKNFQSMEFLKILKR